MKTYYGAVFFAVLIGFSGAATATECQYSGSRAPNTIPGYNSAISCDVENSGNSTAGGSTTGHSSRYRMSYGNWTNTSCGSGGHGWHISGVDSCGTGKGSGKLSCGSVLLSVSGNCE